ncbi:hypothetical protein J6590_042862 [Homalodisca vitripennis]|nr:hypothetical protein J6590_042862 [Homalodisca vitripennis]
MPGPHRDFCGHYSEISGTIVKPTLSPNTFVAVLYQKRLKKERKARRRLQDQLELEMKRRQQLEEALKNSGAPPEALRILNESASEPAAQPPPRTAPAEPDNPAPSYPPQRPPPQPEAPPAEKQWNYSGLDLINSGAAFWQNYSERPWYRPVYGIPLMLISATRDRCKVTTLDFPKRDHEIPLTASPPSPKSIRKPGPSSLPSMSEGKRVDFPAEGAGYTPLLTVARLTGISYSGKITGEYDMIAFKRTCIQRLEQGRVSSVGLQKYSFNLVLSPRQR